MIDPRPILEELDRITEERHLHWLEFWAWVKALGLGVGLTLLALWCGYWLSR